SSEPPLSSSRPRAAETLGSLVAHPRTDRLSVSWPRASQVWRARTLIHRSTFPVRSRVGRLVPGSLAYTRSPRRPWRRAPGRPLACPRGSRLLTDRGRPERGRAAHDDSHRRVPGGPSTPERFAPSRTALGPPATARSHVGRGP